MRIADEVAVVESHGPSRVAVEATWVPADRSVRQGRTYGTGVGQNTQMRKVAAAIQSPMITAAATQLVGRSDSRCTSARNSTMSVSGIILMTRKRAIGRRITS